MHASAAKRPWLSVITCTAREEPRFALMADSLAARLLKPRLLLSLPRAGVRLSTLLRCAWQVLRERFNVDGRRGEAELRNGIV